MNELLPGEIVGRHGLVATAVEVLLDRPGKRVTRVVCAGDAAVVVKVDADTGAFTSEVASIRRLAAAGLPVPEVIGTGPSHLVLRWIDGEGLTSSSSPAAQRDAGAILRRVHAIPAGPPYGGNATVDLWIAGWLNFILPWWARNGGTDAWVSAAWDWYHRIRPLLAVRGGCLTLFDGRPEHFIVSGSAVAGMIDLHDVCAGDPAMDLAVLAVSDPRLLDEVVAGYRPTTDETAVFAELIPFYLLLRRLAAAEWQQTHGDPARTPELLSLCADVSGRPL